MPDRDLKLLKSLYLHRVYLSAAGSAAVTKNFCMLVKANQSLFPYDMGFPLGSCTRDSGRSAPLLFGDLGLSMWLLHHLWNEVIPHRSGAAWGGVGACCGGGCTQQGVDIDLAVSGCHQTPPTHTHTPPPPVMANRAGFLRS